MTRKQKLQEEKDLQRLLELTKRHKNIMDKNNVLVSIYTNATGYLWNMMMNEGGTDLGWSADNGNCEWGIAFKSYEDALEDAVSLVEKCNLKKFQKETPKGKFHWGNYAEHLDKYRSVEVLIEETPKGTYTIFEILAALAERGINARVLADNEDTDLYLDLTTEAKSHLHLYQDGTLHGRYDYEVQIDLSQDLESIMTDLCKEFSKAQHLRSYGQEGWMRLCKAKGVELEMLM